jgi:quaternary ammonium compound-resistance protein SugE
MEKSWTYIIAGGISEIVWAVSMKYSDGFTDIPWTAAAMVFIVLSRLRLSRAIGGGMPLGTAYAVWVGIGAAGVFVCGVLFMDDPANAARIMFVGVIITGIVGLRMTSSTDN